VGEGRGGGGFVQEEHLRVGDEGRRQIQSSAHAAAVLPHRLAAGVGEAEALQQLVGAHARVAGAEVVEAAEHLQVLVAAQLLVQGRMLPEQSDAQAHLVRLAHHVLPGHLDTAAVRPQQGGQDPDQGRLARAVRAEHCVHGAARDREVEPVQCVLAGFAAVPLACLFDGDRRVGH
jgi:hypothetical protein